MRRSQISRALAIACVTICTLAGVVTIFTLTALPKSTYEGWQKRWLPNGYDEAARAFIVDLENGNVDPVLFDMDARYHDAASRQKIRKIVSFLEPERGGTIELFAVNGSGTVGAAWSWRMTYKVDGGGHTVLVQEVLANGPTGIQLQSIYSGLTNPAMFDEHPFSFARRSAGEDLFLIAALTDAMFVIVVLYVCACTPYVRLRWLWLLLSGIGLSRLALNEETGAMSFQPISVNVPSATIFAPSHYGPWILSISLPAGAIVFLVMRRRLMEPPAPAALPLPDPESA